MENGIITFLINLIEKGAFHGGGFEIITIIILYVMHQQILKPMKENIERIKDIKESLAHQITNEKEYYEDLYNTLLKLENFLNNLDGTEKTNIRQITEIKRDVEQIKQILNQFHGHMLYSNLKRNNDFGNYELR